MKHKDFKDRAELLEAAAASIRMQEAAGVEPVVRVGGLLVNKRPIQNTHFDSEKFNSYQFPLAVVEGKPVWEGDELYFHTGQKGTVIGYSDEDEQLITADDWYFAPKLCSWNPTKPKTVMVELLEEAVEAWMKLRFIPPMHDPSYRIFRACADAIKAKE